MKKPKEHKDFCYVLKYTSSDVQLFNVLHVPCFTAERFVTEPCSVFPSVYDMELGKIMALPHREVYVLKIVRDNLDEADCEAFEDEAAWEQVRALLIGKGLIEKRLG